MVTINIVIDISMVTIIRIVAVFVNQVATRDIKPMELILSEVGQLANININMGQLANISQIASLVLVTDSIARFPNPCMSVEAPESRFSN